MLVPPERFPTTGAFGFYVLGAGILTSLLVLAARRRTRFAPLLVVLGLWFMAGALGVLKDRTVPWNTGGDANFLVVRNLLSLTLAAVPLSLALLIRPRVVLASCALLGVAGALCLLTGVLGFLTSLGEERHLWISVARVPGAFLLMRDGNLQVARWLWCAGALLITYPSLKRRASPAPELATGHSLGMSLTMVGLGLSSLAMGIFFWHQSDDSHRFYAYGFVSSTALVAPLLVFGERRLSLARHARHALAAVNAVIALWLATGVAGGDFPDGSQSLMDGVLTPVLLLLHCLIPPLLVLALLAKWVTGGFRDREQTFK